jgi:hypothetical protein
MPNVLTAPGSIDSDFVEEWAGRYRRDAAKSPWRPGPKMKLAMQVYPQLEALDQITNYWDLEEHVFSVLGPAVRSAGAYTVPQFVTVGYWKTPRQLSNYLENEGPAVLGVTKKALAAKTPAAGRTGALVRGLSGVRVRVASALLTVWRPEQFTIIDVWALTALSGLGEQIDGVAFAARSHGWWDSNYDLYLRACLAIVERVQPFTLRDLDRALWKWGQITSKA